MSQENVEIVDRAIATTAARGVATPRTLPSRDRGLGVAGASGRACRKGLRRSRSGQRRISRDSFEEWSLEFGEVLRRWDERGARAHARECGRRARGAALRSIPQMAYLLTIRDGRVVEWGLFGDRSKALEAAGLGE